MGAVLCEHCAAACCRYLALPIDKPRTRRDFDDIRWFLFHEGISVFVEEGEWYIQFQARCKHLQPDSRCGAYEERPAICAEYKAGDCDYAIGPYNYEHHFTHAEQLEEFYRRRTGRKLGPRRAADAGGRRRARVTARRPVTARLTGA
ncbi:MAG TPA: YkgJ family cysteine cluster protein [Phycisphaerae bacterium]|nr:YkgJ family cysteine cluster protein [Phycisphaerae bacterium]HNU44578.1 YkgJ family cysteine cluster protein [Phycisphaerae bacterium]